MLSLGTKLYFRGTDGNNGQELFVSDGTASGTSMVVDIYTGYNNNANVDHLAALTGTGLAAFAADNGVNGTELWVSDGTANGTRMVMDIRPGAVSSSPKWLVELNSKIYFSATDGTNGNELWVSDGTASGTSMVKDISSGSTDSDPEYLYVWNNKTYFSATDGSAGKELCVSDGTSSGTSLLKEIRTGSSGSEPKFFIAFQNKLYFQANDGTHGEELWVSDGTPGNTSMVVDYYTGGVGSKPSWPALLNSNTLMLQMKQSSSAGSRLTRFNGTHFVSLSGGSLSSMKRAAFLTPKPGGGIVFQGDATATKREVWVTDGTESGTSLFKDCNPGSGHGRPDMFTEMNGVIYFQANSGILGKELWVLGSTPASTSVFKDVNPKTMAMSLGQAGDTSQYGPSALWVASESKLYFSAWSFYNGTELWVSDGTLAGMSMIVDLVPGQTEGFYQNLGRTDNGKIYYIGGSAADLYVTDGTAAGTSMAFDSSGDWMKHALHVGNNIFVSAQNDTALSTGYELFVTDGTPGGTSLVKDIRSGAGSQPKFFCSMGNKLYFQANDGVHGIELWVSDGTTAGTSMVRDIWPGTSTRNGDPKYCKAMGNKIYFQAQNGTVGKELFVSDGTAAGTSLVKDINSASGSQPEMFGGPVNNRLYFRANDGSGVGDELWATDGTPSGTSLVSDVDPSGNGYPNYMLAGPDNKVYFQVKINNVFHIYETNGSASGTRQVPGTRSGSGRVVAYDGAYTLYIGDNYNDFDGGLMKICSYH